MNNPNQPQNPDFGGVQLTEEDYAFMEFIQAEIDEDGQIPFTYPIESMPRVIKKSAMYFYEEYDDAVQEQWYLIKDEDIKKFGRSERDTRDENQNTVIKLPEQIQNIYQIRSIRQGGCTACGNMAKFAPWGMLSYMSGPLNGSYSSINRQRSTMWNNLYDREAGFQEGLVRMFEVQQYSNLFTKGIRHSYNKNSHELIIMGAYTGDIIISAFKRLPPHQLYNDRKFVEHVTASCLERMGRVVNSLNFKYPGNVTLNMDEITADGKERRKEVEKDIKETCTGANLMLSPNN